jgi:hypothetical protein
MQPHHAGLQLAAVASRASGGVFMTTEGSSRHSEALRLFEAGLRAFYEATGPSAAPKWAGATGDDARPCRLFDPRPPAATASERTRELADAT